MWGNSQRLGREDDEWREEGEQHNVYIRRKTWQKHYVSVSNDERSVRLVYRGHNVDWSNSENYSKFINISSINDEI